MGLVLDQDGGGSDHANLLVAMSSPTGKNQKANRGTGGQIMYVWACVN